MVTGRARVRGLVMALALAGSGLTVLPGAAHAQDAEARLRKIEAEVRALQRTVFPGGDGRFFAPEVTAPQSGGQGGSTTGTSAVTDILGRLDSLEAQLQRLTSANEENSNAIAQLSARLDALTSTVPAPDTSVAAVSPPVATPAPLVTPAPTPAPAPAPAPKPVAPSAERVAAVSMIVKPKTDDPGEDEYSYGFRLWDARFYPEAQQQLRLFVDKYPKHARISYARNLLGRAYLDDGKLDDAATWFYQNYNADRAGERAPDSLLFLAETMIAKKDSKRACVALAEFGESYPALATGRLQAQYKADTARVDCKKG